MLCRKLFFGVRHGSHPVIINDENNRQVPNGRVIHRLVNDALLCGAIAEKHHGDRKLVGLPFQFIQIPKPVYDSAGGSRSRPHMADKLSDVPVNGCMMHVAVATAHKRFFLTSVIGKVFQWSKSEPKKCCLTAMPRKYPVNGRVKRVRSACCYRLFANTQKRHRGNKAHALFLHDPADLLVAHSRRIHKTVQFQLLFFCKTRQLSAHMLSFSAFKVLNPGIISTTPTARVNLRNPHDLSPKPTTL